MRWVVGAALLGLLPFVGKAFHVDDVLFLWAAKQIHANPLDFYGFEANWYGFPAPMNLVIHNPPLAAYYLALAALPFGWSEIALHGAFLLPALGFVLGVYALSRALCDDATLPALAAVVSPAFLVSATNVMSDVLMVALYVWAAVFWIRGLGSRTRGPLLLSAALVACASLTKYFAISLVPLLVAYTLARRRSWDARVLWLGIPFGVLLLYEAYTRSLYGEGLLLRAMSYAAGSEELGTAGTVANTFSGLAFLGGGASVAFFYAPLLWSRRRWALGGASAFALLTLFLLLAGEGLGLPVRGPEGVRWSFLLQLSLFTLAGVHVIAIAAVELREARDATALLLLLWLLGTFVFTVYVNWTVSGRTILPLVPAACVLLARRMERGDGATSPRRYWPLVPAACLALAVTWADASWANVQRSAARAINAEVREFSRQMWFQGHWGFQYYMEAQGAKALNRQRVEFDVGDYVVVPKTNTNTGRLPAGVRFVKSFRFPTRAPCATMSAFGVGAGFYSSLWGPVPYLCGATRPEEFSLFEVVAR